MERIGSGRAVAALLNARAKRVNRRVVRKLQHALPHATVLLSEDLDQARRQAQHLVEQRPALVLAGGGDGSIARLLNLLRDVGAKELPAIGILKLGTGNGWAHVTGARSYDQQLALLPRLPLELPTRRFDLLEVEGTLCHFAGVGWDARVLNDYLRNLDKRSSQLIGSRLATRLHKGLGGYMYSLFRLTIPEEYLGLRKYGQPRVTLTDLGGDAYGLNSQAAPVKLTPADGRVLYDGPLSVGAGATTPEWGFGFKSFPFCQALPGYLNLRVYDRPVLEATRNMMNLWRGVFPQPGMHDFFVKKARMTFSRPMPFQIAGDGLGVRDHVDFKLADLSVSVVDWGLAERLAR